MRARLLVWIVIALLVLPPTVPATAQTSDDIWGAGQQLTRRGEFARARQFYADLVAQVGPIGAPRALVLEARAALADGDTAAAEATLQSLLSAYPNSDQSATALLTLAQARRTAGDCAGALRALDAFEAEPSHPALGPYLPVFRAQCLGKVGDWQGELAMGRAGLAMEGGGPRLTRIELLERAAEGATSLGRKQDAFDYYNQALDLATTRAYRAEMLFTTATMARALGRPEVDRFRAVVVDYPESARAPEALDALVDAGRGGTVSLLQAGTVRLKDKDYEAALALFDKVPPTNADAGAAGVGRATALVKLGREDDARIGLAALADNVPNAAGMALLQLGQLQLRAGEFAKADNTYGRMLSLAPDYAAEALLWSGISRYVRSDLAGALDAWDRGLWSQPSPQVEAELHFWRAKVLPAGSAEASDALTRTISLVPDSYYGLRADELLSASTLAAAALVDEAGEHATWLAAQGTSADQLLADLSATPGLNRAMQLLDLGLNTEASWEIDGLLQGYAAGNDVAHLGALADWLMQHDLPQLALLVGKAERDAVGLSNLPRAEQKHAYPAAWADLVFEQSARYSVDPLLLLAVMRQESSFDPRAQSPAQARGLTQVVPSTAQAIAARLGREYFDLRDLFKPAVSLEFGSWYLAQLLKEWDGRPIHALAAYNAGSGNVTRWQQRFGPDPDVLVELLPFTETQTYVRIVYDSYRHYHQLYGARSGL
jgi:soluble lytic murein transglycosylase